jgi:VCBS repeat protein/FG-GAP repeat protein
MRHPGVTESYRFDERGIEQEFSISGPAPAGPSGLPVVLEMRLSGPLSSQAARQESSIVFMGQDGQVALRYGDLKVTDATGAVLPASLALVPGAIQIRIQDEKATYPLMIDPLLTTPAWTSSFGSRVAGAGDVNGDGFDDVVVASLGTAYVYQGTASGVSQAPSWTSPFGGLIAGAGDVNGDGYDDVLSSGPYFFDKPNLYYGSPSGLSATPGWTPQDTPDQPEIKSIASAGDVNGDGFDDIIVGSSNGFTNPAVRVYLGAAGGAATAPSWTITQADPYTALGYSVASAGDVDGDGFDEVLVGEPLYSVTEPVEMLAVGRARLYSGSALGLDQEPSWVTQRLVQFGWLGSAVASAGDLNADGFADVLVGGLNGFRGTEPGIVQVYLGSASGPGLVPALEVTGDGFLTHLGTAVAPAGDVNGDGFDDFLAGEPDYDHSETVESVGRTYLFKGKANGVEAGPAWQVQGEHPFQSVGISVASAGDANGDGFEDVLVGSFEGASLYLGAADNHVPLAQCAALAQTECTSPAGAAVQLDASTSSDADSTPGTRDDIATYEWFEDFGLPAQALIATGVTASPNLPLGSHVITLRITDRAGATATESLTITVADTRKPALSATLSRELLWPPSHQMVLIHASVDAQDACGATQVLLSSISSDEADDAPGKADGSTVNDIQGAAFGTPDLDFLVRSERSELGDGRIYTVVYRATDATGNVSWIARHVSVPMNHRDLSRLKRSNGTSQPQVVDGGSR